MVIEYVFLSGKTKWFRPHMPNQWHKYEHQLYLSGEELEKFRKLQESTANTQGVKNQLKKDEDGYYVRLTRPASKEIKGKVVGFNPPLVYMADGVTPLVGVMVGNDSDVTTKLEKYRYPIPAQSGKYGIALRWLSTRVDNLVPFDGNNTTLPEHESYASAGLKEQPKQLF
jgi:hypothetical protein